MIIEHISSRNDFQTEQLEIQLFAKVLASGSDARVAVSIYNLVSRSFVE